MKKYVKPSIAVLTVNTIEPLCLSGPQAGDIGNPGIEDTSRPHTDDAVFNNKSVWEE